MGQVNYLRQQQQQAATDEEAKKKKEEAAKRRAAQAPDTIVHTPPIVHYFIGGIGILFGFSANIWQIFTTWLALVSMMSPSGKIEYGSLGWKAAIAALIACATQFGLTILVWRIDTRWKQKNAASPAGKPGDMIKGYGLAAVEVIQHIDLVTAWGLVAFAVDTVGDYTFVAGVLTGIDPTRTVFLTFLYATSLYALSTIGFVRSVEYIWAGLIVSTRYVQDLQKQVNQTQGPVPK
jgi:hypothetical protein